MRIFCEYSFGDLSWKELPLVECPQQNDAVSLTNAATWVLFLSSVLEFLVGKLYVKLYSKIVY